MPFWPAFRALAHRNFRLYFAGQGVSLIGTWMQQVAMSWLVYQLTENAAWLGLTAFAAQVPSFFLAPMAGALIDRWDRRRLILTTQTLAMLQAFALAALSLADVVTVPQIMTLSVVLGIITAFDMPGRQSFLMELVVGREDLANAIALNSSLFNGARLIGPALAGAVLTWTSAGVCFLINGISYLAVLVALLAIHVPSRPRQHAGLPLLQGVREGLAYAFGFAPIRAILLLLALTSVAGMSYSVLLPLYTDERWLGGGATTLGLLTTAAGLGALAGATFLAVRKTVLGLGKWIAAGPGLFALGLLAFSFSQTLWLSLLCLAASGFALMVYTGASNTVVQTLVEEDKRGRVLSLYTMAFMGMAPVGSLLIGYLAAWLGPGNALRIGATACAVGSLAFLLRFRQLRAQVRPVYVRMGILPEMPSGVYPALAPPAPTDGRALQDPAERVAPSRTP